WCSSSSAWGARSSYPRSSTSSRGGSISWGAPTGSGPRITRRSRARSQPLGVPNGFRLGEREDAFERLIGLPGRLRGGYAHAVDRLGGRCLELPPVRGAGEVDSADVHVGGEVGAHLVDVTGEDVHHPTGHVGGGEHFGEFQGGQGAVLGGEDDGGVAAGDDR